MNRRDTPTLSNPGGKPPPLLLGKRPVLPGRRYPDPTEERTTPHIALRSARRSAASPQAPGTHAPQPPPGSSPHSRTSPSALAGSHLRGAPVAELVGDGLDTPGSGHRNVAALRAHIQPHHRHGRLAVLLRLGSGSGSASSGRPPAPSAAASCPGRARLPRSPTAPLSLGRTNGQSAWLAPPPSRRQWQLSED